MNRIKPIILLCFLLGFTVQANAQTQDAGLWLGFKLEKKLHNWAGLSLSQELRFNENISELGTAFTELSYSTGWHSNFNGGIAYRFIQKRQVDDSYEIRHRYFLELSYRYKFNRAFSLTLRERFQNQYKDINRMSDGITKEYSLRSKMSLKYNPIKKLTLDASCEVFYQLNNPDGNEIDNLRYGLGAEYKLTKKQSIEAFYLIDQEIHVNDPWTSYVMGLGYTFEF
jgi:hypothetical protein